MLGPAVVCCCWLGLPFICHATEHSPPLMHGEVFDPEEHLDIASYWVSEKLDGVRAYWDGKQLVTRAGHPIAAPEWFTHGWPSVPLDGELWGGRGTFERTSGVVRRSRPDDGEWRGLTFEVFDLPADIGTFDERLRRLQDIVRSLDIEWLRALAQDRVNSIEQLRSKLADVEASGGEGLMLRRADAVYIAGRSDDLLKYKSFDDAEARVIGHLPGKGKYVGMMGALLVATSDGRQFKIGSGFTDAERREPPAIGQWVTYAFNGLTESGLPRFARFVRARPENVE
jgi:DNA ligase-1